MARPGAGAACAGRQASSSAQKASARSTALQHFEQSRRAHAAADAHRDHDITGAAALALDQRVTGHPRARHAVRMADRDRAAIDVEPVVRDAELVAAVENLDGDRKSTRLNSSHVEISY